jgi:hypothetical protein
LTSPDALTLLGTPVLGSSAGSGNYPASTSTGSRAVLELPQGILHLPAYVLKQTRGLLNVNVSETIDGGSAKELHKQ